MAHSWACVVLARGSTSVSVTRAKPMDKYVRYKYWDFRYDWRNTSVGITSANVWSKPKFIVSVSNSVIATSYCPWLGARTCTLYEIPSNFDEPIFASLR